MHHADEVSNPKRTLQDLFRKAEAEGDAKAEAGLKRAIAYQQDQAAKGVKVGDYNAVAIVAQEMRRERREASRDAEDRTAAFAEEIERFDRMHASAVKARAAVRQEDEALVR